MKNLLYRKTILKNLYYFSKHLSLVMDYEDYKRVILNDLESSYEHIELLKKLYLSHFIILENKATDVKDMLSFFEEFILEKEIGIKIDIKEEMDNVIEKIIFELSYKVKEEKYRYALMYLLINYVVYLKKETMYRYSNKFLKKLHEVVCIKELSLELIMLLKEEIKRGYNPDIEFYKNLKELSKEEIISTFKKNKTRINETYLISHLYLFGSFVKNSYRIDSDIDVAVVFKANMSYKQKEEKVTLLKQYIKETFKRYGDVMEYNKAILKDEKREKIY